MAICETECKVGFNARLEMTFECGADAFGDWSGAPLECVPIKTCNENVTLDRTVALSFQGVIPLFEGKRCYDLDKQVSTETLGACAGCALQSHFPVLALFVQSSRKTMRASSVKL